MATLAELLIEVDVDADRVGVKINRAADDVDDAFDRMADRAERHGGRLSGTMRRVFGDVGDGAEDESSRLGSIGSRFLMPFGRALLAAAKPVAVAAGVGFSAQFITSVAAGLVSGAKKVAHGVAAIGALLPAAAVTGVLAMASLKIAVLGVGDAISAGLAGDTEAFDEALKGLSPSARTVAREVVGLRDQIDALKSTVQERFFAQFEGQVERLGGTWLPMLRRQLGASAESFGAAVDQAARFLGTPDVIKAVDGALRNGNTAIGNMTSGLGGLLGAFLPLVTVGSTFLPQLTSGFEGVTQRLALFMQHAADTGQLAEFIQGGLDKLRELWETAKQLGRIFADIGGIGDKIFAAAGIGAGGLLDTIEDLVDKANRFLETPKGAKGLETVFSTLRTVVGGFVDNLKRVGDVIADAIGPHIPDIVDFLEAFVKLKGAVLDVGLDALAPILGTIGNILGNVVLPALTGLANFLATNKPVLQGIGIAIMTLLIPAFVSWAVSAGAAALATLLAMAPLILIGLAIAVLAALVITHFDTIKNAIATAFNWVKDNWPLLLAILTGPIGIAVLLITRHWDTIKDGITAVKDWIVDRFNDVVSFISGLPGKISDAASGMWDGITGAFKAAINGIIGLWNGLSFPSVTIGGQDPLGRFGPSLPEVTIGGWDLPNIPTLAAGAILRATPGGVPFVGAEAGMDEAVIPLPRGMRDLGGMGRRGDVHVHVAGSILTERDLVRLVRDELERGGFAGLAA